MHTISLHLYIALDTFHSVAMKQVFIGPCSFVYLLEIEIFGQGQGLCGQFLENGDCGWSAFAIPASNRQIFTQDGMIISLIKLTRRV